MLDVAAAREIVLRHARPLPAELVVLEPDIPARLLADSVTADIDSPPFDKSMMDGYAVRAADCAATGVVLRVIGEVQAGAVSQANVVAGEAVRIFTGAPIPPGADAVVKQEETTANDRNVKVLKVVSAGANILRRGSEMNAGDVVLPRGTALSPVALGLLAAVGRTAVWVAGVPTVGVIATGNELVDAGTKPSAGEIRNSNGPMVATAAMRRGANIVEYGIVYDTDEDHRLVFTRALEKCDVLIVCGGVSVGKYDLVPDVLKSLGVEIHFHTVRMKPGKPLLFGTKGDTLVFGLPGNPVSAAVGFELFVRPAIDIMCGRTDPGPKELRLPLSESLSANHDRPTYHPAVVGADSVRPLPWKGSADLRALLPANGYVVIPPGDVKLTAGDAVDVIVTG